MNKTIRRMASCVLIIVIVTGGVLGNVHASEQTNSQREIQSNASIDQSVSETSSEEVDLDQDLLLVESGERVVIDGRNTTTPTNFSVRKGGTLIIKNSTLFRTGEHHNDNGDFVKGELIIINSTIYGEEQIPIEVTGGIDAEIHIQDSNLEKFNSKYPGVSFYQFSGDKLLVENSEVGMIEPTISPHVETNVTIRNAKIHRIGLSIEGFSNTVTVKNLSREINDLDFNQGEAELNIENVSMWQLPDFNSRGYGNNDQLQHVRLINSTARTTIHSQTNFTAINSTTVSLGFKFAGIYDRNMYYFSNLVKYGSFRDRQILNKSYMKVRLVNSTIPEWYKVENEEKRFGALNVNSPGGGKNSEDPDFELNDSNIYAIKVGHNLTAKNVNGNRVSLYNNYGGQIRFNNSTFDSYSPLRIVQGANVTIWGNVSFSGEVENFGDLSYLTIERQYPVNISNINAESDGEDIQVIVINPEVGKIYNTSYDTDADFIFPEVKYRLSNYGQNFTLVVKYQNHSVTHPLTLTTDTPIRINETFNEPASFVVSYTVDNETVEPDEQITVTATVENTGDLSGATTVNFYADGEEFATETVEIGGGNSKDVTATMSFDTTGTHNVSVNDLDATDITVESSVLEVIAGEDHMVSFTEVLEAISAYNTDSTIEGQAIGFSDVLDAISAYNTNTKVGT